MRVFAENDDSEVVISGMSGRFPNSRNIADLDYHLYNKVPFSNLFELKSIISKL